MRSVKNLFSLTLATLSLLYLASGCGKDPESSAATTSKIKIMAEDQTTVLIESFELKEGETYAKFHDRVSASTEVKALKLADKKAIANNNKIHSEIRTFLDGKSITELGYKHLYRFKKSDALVSDPSKLKDKDELYIQVYVDYEAILTDAILTDADLTDADLTEANLTGADLTGADLTGADLTEANLTRAKLTRAKLTGAILTGAILTGADLTDADLTGAILAGAILADADLTGAILTRANAS